MKKMNEIQEIKNDFLKEKYYYVPHESGLRIYIFPKKMTSTYAIIGTKFGSCDVRFRLKGEEQFTEILEGTAHFLEHKMFEKENHLDVTAIFHELGAYANAYTTFDRTAYLFSCTDRFEKSLETLLKMVTQPYFTPETVAKEQGIIGQEIRMYEDHPGWQLIIGLLEAMYEKNTVRVDTVGTIESISRITDEILYRCYKVFYNLSNMALCISGDVSPQQVLQVADKVLQKEQKIEFESVVFPEPEEVYRKRVVRKLQISRPLFAIGVKDTKISKSPLERGQKIAQMSVLCYMLFGRSSHFYCDLYEKGMISSSFSYEFEHTERFSHILLSGSADDPDLVFGEFCAYIHDLREKGLSMNEFENAKRVVYADMAKDYDSTEDIANEMLLCALEGVDIFSQEKAMKDVTLESVEKLFVDLFQEEKYSLSIVEPEEVN